MSYIYLQEQGEESLADNFKDIPAYVLSRLNLTQDKSYCNGSETESCHGSQSGMISTPLTENLGEEKSTSFAEDFLAKTFPQLEKELESRANALGFGDKWPGWFAKYDQDLSLWKTPQCSLLEDYIEFSETWPNWGMMRDGACWELTTSVLRTEERESGYWPTPNTLEGLKPKTLESIQEYNQKARPGRSYCNMNLREIVVYGKQPIRPIRMIPTPTCSDAFTSNLKSTQQKPDTMHSVSLAQLCEKMPEKMWPTPTTSDRYNTDPVHDKNRGFLRMEAHPSESKSMTASEVNKKNGQLNPDWVEWLMGWPIGWTKTEPIKLDWRNWVVDPADIGEVPRVSQSITNRVSRLKAIGNGQVPLVVVNALNILMDGL